jgi:tRNA A-37 threonylcarbamoyl transferase component Bud32
MGYGPDVMLESETLGGSGILAAPTGGFAAGTILKETYRIVRPLAEGGCGEVYLAAHTRLPGTFAVKVLRPSLTRDREALARFRQEAEITSTLRHPHIVQVFDFDVTDDGVNYLVMELLEGVPLADLVRSGAPLEPRRAVNIVEQIAQALHAAHERGVVHRDLKPDNVMLLSSGGSEDFVKVLDFGISQASWRTRLTDNSDRVSGTPQYMAPEQAQGLRDQIDHRTDQFSLAAIAYTLFTGREPFSGDNPIAVLYQVVHHEPPAPAGGQSGARGGHQRRDRARTLQGVGGSLRRRPRVRRGAARCGRRHDGRATFGSSRGRASRRGRHLGGRHGRRAVRHTSRTRDQATHPSHPAQERRSPADPRAHTRGGSRDVCVVSSEDARADAGGLGAGRRSGAQGDRPRPLIAANRAAGTAT